MNILHTACTGEYTPVGNPSTADCILAQSFGAGRHGTPGTVNEALARFICDTNDSDLPLLVQGQIADALTAIRPDADPYVVRGEPSSTAGGGLGTWELLTACRAYMDQHGLRAPLLVAQAAHVGRVARQAEKLGILPITPPHLPYEFDPESIQWWTRSQTLWTARELPSLMYLKLVGRL